MTLFVYGHAHNYYGGVLGPLNMACVLPPVAESYCWHRAPIWLYLVLGSLLTVTAIPGHRLRWPRRSAATALTGLFLWSAFFPLNLLLSYRWLW